MIKDKDQKPRRQKKKVFKKVPESQDSHVVGTHLSKGNVYTLIIQEITQWSHTKPFHLGSAE